MPRVRGRGHEVLEHTADVGLRVWAPDLDGLFAEGAVGLVALMGRARGEPGEHAHVELEAPDTEALFVDWLSEVLFLFDARGFVPVRVEVHVERERCRLAADLAGVKDGFVGSGPEVKAVTYHGLTLRESAEGCEARVYLDV